jgi:hypothetical protein
VSVAFSVVPFRLAEITTAVELETPFVVIENDAVLAPAGTTTDWGTTASGLLERRVMVEPPAGAIPLRVTDPVLVFPPGTSFGETTRPIKEAGKIASVAVC